MAKAKKNQNSEDRSKDTKQRYEQNKKELDKILSSLNPEDPKDVRLLQSIVYQARSVMIGAETDSAGNMAINYNFESIRELVKIMITANSVGKSIAHTLSSTNMRNVISFNETKVDYEKLLGLGKNVESAIVKATEDIETVLSTCFENGLGTRRDIKEYHIGKIKAKSDDIIKLVKAGKSKEEIAKTLELSLENFGSYQTFIGEYLEDNYEGVIYKEHAAGKSDEEIALKLKVPENELARFIKKAKREYTSAIKDEMIQMHKDGKSDEEIASKFNIPNNRVNGLINNWMPKPKKAKQQTQPQKQNSEQQTPGKKSEASAKQKNKPVNNTEDKDVPQSTETASEKKVSSSDTDSGF